MLKKFTESERHIIVRCMEILLDGDIIHPIEFGTLLGIDEQTLRKVIQAFPFLDNSVGDYESFGVTQTDVYCAINGCLLHVRGEVRRPNNDLKKRYVIDNQDIVSVYEKWKALKAQVWDEK